MSTRRYLSSAYRRHPVVSTGLAVAVVIASLALSARGLEWARWELFGWRVGHASSVPAAGETHMASWAFAFGDRAVKLQVPVSSQELEAARGVDTRAMFGAVASIRAHNVMHVVTAQSRSAFVDSLTRELRRVRSERLLDDDEYLELVVRAVQSLPFNTAGRRVRLPVEVVASGFGVCSEKALLLAALMVHEGYETGLWVFDSQNHVALGVGSDAAQFKDSGFAFIETTRNAYVGEYNAVYLASGPVSRPPQFIPLGGHRRYQAGAEVQYILRALAAAKRQGAAFAEGTRSGPHRQRAGSASSLPDGTQKYAARKFVNYLRGQTDQRGVVFERLLRSAAEAALADPPAFIH